MEDYQKKIIELSNEISNLLKDYGNPHIKMEITDSTVTQYSGDWYRPTGGF